jgi:hypothetical protein
MTLLVTLTKWELIVFLAGFGATIVIKLLNGGINTTGLLYGRISGRPAATSLYFSPERAQLLAITIISAVHYLTLVITNPTPGTFPPIPESLAEIVGGSNVLYLGGKAYARWLAK